MTARIALLTVMVSSVQLLRAQEPSSPEPITRVLFGSCVKQQSPMPIFQTMLSTPADLAIFLGDNVYADTDDMTVMRASYDRLAANQDFAGLRAAMPILATWDDHDFGVNDGGGDFPMRAASQQEFLRFWNEPDDSPRHDREGVYNSHLFGPVGKRLQVILLDTRYFRSPLKRGRRRVGGPYVPDADPSKTMLGKRQWEWLAEQLRTPAEVRVIGTSIQCIPEAAGQETWSNLPLERDRLFKLIKDSRAAGVILISGDRHWSELSMRRDEVAYPVYELTSSSFNQIHARGTPTENRFRVGETTYHRENYGVIAIDWAAPEPSLTIQIRDLDDGVQIEKTIRIGELQ